MSADDLIVTASPHIRSLDSTPRIMWHVVASLVPVIVSAAWFFAWQQGSSSCAAICCCILASAQ